jgi:hypothetical protein
MFGKESTLLFSSIDSVNYLNCKKYFHGKYGVELNPKSAVNKILDLIVGFGVKCGGTASPRGRGAEYIDLNKEGISTERVVSLLSSLTPYDKLIGAMLYDKDLHEINKNLVESINMCDFIINYCYGCGGAREKTISQIISETW